MILLLKHLLDALNAYANLLLVIVTIVYVVLNYKSLAAFRDSQLKGSQSRHLDEIKVHVVDPILLWLNEIIDTLAGLGTSFLTTVEWVEDDNRIPRRMKCRPRRFPVNNLSESLLEDAQRAHFPDEIRKYKSFKHISEQLFEDIYSFANECCEALKTTTDLPRLNSINREERFASLDELVHACLPYLLLGEKPKYGLEEAYPTTLMMVRVHNYPAYPVAGDSQVELERWLPRAIDLIQEGWRTRKFTGRITDVRASAEALRDEIQSIQFMQELTGRCKFVGG
jgi:hypothetical protein